MKVQVLPTPRCTGVQYNVFVYTDTKPSQVPKVFSDECEVAFPRCSCELSNIERNQIIKHKLHQLDKAVCTGTQIKHYVYNEYNK